MNVMNVDVQPFLTPLYFGVKRVVAGYDRQRLLDGRPSFEAEGDLISLEECKCSKCGGAALKEKYYQNECNYYGENVNGWICNSQSYCTAIITQTRCRNEKCLNIERSEEPMENEKNDKRKRVDNTGMNSATKEKIRQMLADGVRVKDVAEQLGLNYHCVYAYKKMEKAKKSVDKQNKKAPIPGKLTPEEAREIVDYARQYGYTSTAKKYDISAGTIQYWRKKFDAGQVTEQATGETTTKTTTETTEQITSATPATPVTAFRQTITPSRKIDPPWATTKTKTKESVSTTLTQATSTPIIDSSVISPEVPPGFSPEVPPGFPPGFPPEVPLLDSLRNLVQTLDNTPFGEVRELPCGIRELLFVLADRIREAA